MLRTRVRAGFAAGVVLSIGFALLAVCVQCIDLFMPSWGPTLGYHTPVTLRIPYGTRITRGQGEDDAPLSLEHTRVVVPRGTLLRPNNSDHRAAFAHESLRRPPRPARVASLAAIDLTLALMLTTYLRRFGQRRMRLLRTQIGLLAIMLLVLTLGKMMLLLTGLPEYWVPAAAAPLWVVLSFERRAALVVGVVLSFLVASLLDFDILLLSVALARGLGASLFFISTKRPRQMVIAGGLAGLSASVLLVALAVVYEGNFDIIADLKRGLASLLLACIGGGLTSGLLAHLLRDPVERLLGHVSRDRLFTLADLEQPLLRKMAAEAPGSWEHSRAMANLAEAAASIIGADALLTRVGAYYHDLGKTVQPKYFIENLAHGEPSPHGELDPDVSADAIMAHVVMGAKILRDGGVPEPVVEFAYTHHGTQVVEFFWYKCLELGNPKNLSESHFRYPGMKPQTKETALLMLVDSIEAASRTIDPPERKKFEDMIQRVLFTKLRAGQLDESGLTLEDCHTLLARLPDTLTNMYHSRVKYPWQKEPPSGQTSSRTSLAVVPTSGAKA